MAFIERRKGKDGKVRWRALVRLRGAPSQSGTFSSKTKAKIWAKKVETDIREGRHFKWAEARKHTLAELIDGATIEFAGVRILLDGADVSQEIRSPEVTRYVSVVATVPEVRERIVALQRDAYPGENLVVEGRDIGSVVFPDADTKIYLTATPEERARRRALETGRDAAEVLREQEERDARDKGREHSPLVRAEGAVTVVTDGLSIPEVIDRLAEIVAEAEY